MCYQLLILKMSSLTAALPVPDKGQSVHGAEPGLHFPSHMGYADEIQVNDKEPSMEFMLDTVKPASAVQA